MELGIRYVVDCLQTIKIKLQPEDIATIQKEADSLYIETEKTVITEELIANCWNNVHEGDLQRLVHYNDMQQTTIDDLLYDVLHNFVVEQGTASELEPNDTFELDTWLDD